MILVLYDVNDTNDVMGMEAAVVIEASVLPAVYVHQCCKSLLIGGKYFVTFSSRIDSLF